MKACILIKTETGKHIEVAKKVEKVKGVRISFPVLGRTDVVAGVEVKDTKELGSLVMKVGQIEGVRVSETLVGAEV